MSNEWSLERGFSFESTKGFPEKLVKVIVAKDRKFHIWEVEGAKGKLYVTKIIFKGEIENHEICPDLWSLEKSVKRVNSIIRMLHI